MKRIVSLLLLLSFCLALSACGTSHTHTWTEASCTAPKHCEECGETEGEPLGHAWIEATYTAPKTCSRCGLTEGAPLPETEAPEPETEAPEPETEAPEPETEAPQPETEEISTESEPVELDIDTFMGLVIEAFDGKEGVTAEVECIGKTIYLHMTIDRIAAAAQKVMDDKETYLDKWHEILEGPRKMSESFKDLLGQYGLGEYDFELWLMSDEKPDFVLVEFLNGRMVRSVIE